MIAKRLLLILGLLFTALPLVSGCGYRFPGEGGTAATGGGTYSSIRVTGEGAKLHPALAHRLQRELIRRLGGSLDEGRILRVEMEPVNRAGRLENSSGKIRQYQISVRAKPFQEKAEPGKWPSMEGRATCYEMDTIQASLSARQQAEQDAVDQLADSLAALLASPERPE
ncbi:MAG: hypothetical protein HQL56_13865 [Magnetococcales bacterium]|nr:hypothetical protein [Magnetococcales bacterium]